MNRKVIKRLTSITFAGLIILSQFKCTSANVKQVSNNLEVKFKHDGIDTIKSVIRDLARDIYLSSDAVVENGLVEFIPNQKGKESLLRQGSVPRLHSAKYILPLKAVFLDNEPDVYFATNTLGKNYSFPCEFHYVVMTPSFFDYEAPINIYGLYLGLMGGKIRLTNSDDVFPETNPIPLYKNTVIRVRYNADRSGEVWINNIKLTGIKKTFFFGSNTTPDHIGFGTNTNNSYMSYLAMFGFDQALTDEEADAVYKAEVEKFDIDKDINYPFLKDCTAVLKDGVASIVGKYTGKYPEASRLIKWVIAGNGANPDVTGSKYDTRLDGLSSFEMEDFNLEGYWVRPSVCVTDIKGQSAGVYTSKGFVKLY
ncbi:hypothetical protein [Pedobacter paludis]|uniref:Uncharacterized protein n=1 Tax=Pedobacter paludis TaxID=2203212 RepID=A0A317F789_9SPHI|nr:hypothetical protein [Pedobacter paludis]PWS33819.1 hypothetical protein DF947_04215 [Pedobacter paludis]